MGTKCCTAKCGNELKENEENISKLNFIKKYPIGKGGYGRVNYYYNLFYKILI